jgi:hypothetical protein
MQNPDILVFTQMRTMAPFVEIFLLPVKPRQKVEYLNQFIGLNVAETVIVLLATEMFYLY